MEAHTLIDSLTNAIDSDLDQVKSLSMTAAKDSPEILYELKESERRLGLAKNRDLMDDYQIKLAYRVSVKKVIHQLQKEIAEAEDQI